MSNQRCRGAQEQREHDGEQREVKRVEDRFEKALISCQLDVVLDADEVRDRTDPPVERAHPNGEQPGKEYHRRDQDQRRSDEQKVASPAAGEKARAWPRCAAVRHRRASLSRA